MNDDTPTVDPNSAYGTAKYGTGTYAEYVPPVGAPPPPPVFEELPVVQPGPVPKVTYRWLTFDWVTGRWLGEIRPASWELERILSGAGAGKVTVGVPHDAVQARALLNITQPRRTGLYVERDNVPLWGGLIWKRPWGSSAMDTIVLEAAECWSYFRARYIHHHVAWRAEYGTGPRDQFAIVRDLIRYAQGEPFETGWWQYAQPKGANVGIGFDSTMSGVLREVAYRGHVAPKNIAEAVEQMCDNIGGFDFTVEVGRDSDGSLRRHLSLWHPIRSRPAINTGWRADLGANLVDVNAPDDRGAQATRVIGTNDMGQDQVLRAYALATGLLDHGYPLLEESLIGRNVKVQETLQGKVNAALQQYVEGDGITEVSIDPHSPLMPFGAFELGDEVEVVVPPLSQYDAGPVSARWPYGLRETRRVSSWKCTGSEHGEKVTVRFVEAGEPTLDDETDPEEQ